MDHTKPVEAVVVAEEKVYRYDDPTNGAGPLWCMGSTSLVRCGGELFAAGLEVVAGAEPLHNCRWLLFHRGDTGWQLVHRDEDGRTREPTPLLGLANGNLFLSANPTLTEPGTYDGPAQPQLVQFDAAAPRDEPTVLLPRWSEDVTFNEHSYRNCAADAESNELIIFHNLGMDRAYWSLLDSNGAFAAQGRIDWPWGGDYEVPEAIRLCYNNVLLRNRAVYVIGMSDILEPVKAWRDYKLEVTGRKWDYEMRRIFFSYTPDITSEPFRPWQEIAGREATGGHVQNCDLWVDAAGVIHFLWREFAIDERLRPKFFPDAVQRYSLRYARMQNGVLEAPLIVEEGGEGLAAIRPDFGRFHPTPEGRLFVIYSVSHYEPQPDAPSGSHDPFTPLRVENRVVEIAADGSVGQPTTLPLQHPIKAPFFNATPRAGSPLSHSMELMGEALGEERVMRYARIDLQL